MKLEFVTYKNLPNCIRLANDSVELIVTTNIGPRILVYRYLDGANFMKNFDDQLADIQPDKWQNYGGHRLWHAPESWPRTYHPDNDPVRHEWDGKVLTLKSETESTTGLQKEMSIELVPQGTEIKLRHRIYNRNLWAVEFAPWCLSVMAPGGRAVIPQEPYVPHGSGPGESFDIARPLILWQYTKMNDPRFTWGEKFIQMRQDDRYDSKQKIGGTIKPGWAAYAFKDELFVKHFDYSPTACYPDGGCNAEFFTMPGFLEIESVGPFAPVKPDDFAELNETWQLAKITLDDDEATIANQLKNLL